MNLEIFVSTVMVVVILGAVVIAANYADKRRDARLRSGVYGVLGVMSVGLAVLYGLVPLTGGSDDMGSAQVAGGLALAVAVGAASLALLSQRVREWLSRWLPPRTVPAEPSDVMAAPGALMAAGGPPDQPLFPQMLNYYTTAPQSAADMPGDARHAPASQAVSARGFDPRSAVHTVALVFCVYLLGTQFIAFVQEGGLKGVAAGFAEGLTVWDLLLNGLPLLIIPVLGVGLGIRRTFRLTLERLGLGQLSLRGLGVAVGMTVALLVMVSIVGSTWQYLVPPETFQEQTQASDALAESVTTIWLALVLAASAAISEEIAFRGALQPVLGFWVTAIVFALTHIQYALTPATLIILGVAVAFGWIRARYNTTVAIVTHFLYNFIPLALNVAVGTEALRWLSGVCGLR